MKHVVKWLEMYEINYNVNIFVLGNSLTVQVLYLESGKNMNIPFVGNVWNCLH